MLLSFHKDTTTIKRAAEFLNKTGWQVFDIKKDSANGPDLTIAKGGRSYRVEIKKAIVGEKHCTVKAIQQKSRHCDAVGILFPNNRVVLQPMKEHLLLCSKSGIRSVTNLMRLNQ